jgi:hypothetical protein
MDISTLVKRSWIVCLLLMFAACGGGGGGSDDDNNPPATTPNISLSESNYDFGGIVAENSADKEFVITNTGNANLIMGQISSSNNTIFSLLTDTDTCSNATLAANATCSLTTRFSPAAEGSLNATLSIPSNDPDGTATIGLSGQGYGLDIWISKVEINNCTVTMEVTVTDPATGEFKQLTANQFTVTSQNQSVVQGVLGVSHETPVAISAVLALDWSESELGVLTNIKTASNSFIDLLTHASDEAAAYKFDGAIGFAPDTGLYQQAEFDTLLKPYISGDITSTGGTLLYDALYASIERAALGTSTTGKPAVIVLSDGVHNATVTDSFFTLDDVIAKAREEEVPVFSIYYFDPAYKAGYFGRSDIMQQLAGDTGGKYFNGTDGIDIAEIYAQISNVLTNKSTITFTSTICSGTLTMDVGATDGVLHGKASVEVTFP